MHAPNLDAADLHRHMYNGESLWDRLLNDRRKMRDEGKNISPDYWALIREQFQLKDLGDAFTCKGDEPVDGMLMQVTVSRQMSQTHNIKNYGLAFQCSGSFSQSCRKPQETWGARNPCSGFISHEALELATTKNTHQRTKSTLISWLQSTQAMNLKEAVLVFRLVLKANYAANANELAFVLEVMRCLARLELCKTYEQQLQLIIHVCDGALLRSLASWRCDGWDRLAWFRAHKSACTVIMDAEVVEQALIEENGATWMNHATTIEQTASGSMLGERLFADSADRVRLLRFSQVASHVMYATLALAPAFPFSSKKKIVQRRCVELMFSHRDGCTTEI